MNNHKQRCNLIFFHICIFLHQNPDLSLFYPAAALDFSASPTSVQFVSTTSFFLGQFPTVPLAPLTEKRHSRLLRIAVRAGGFLGVLQEISQRVVLRETENIVFLRFPQGRFSLK